MLAAYEHVLTDLSVLKVGPACVHTQHTLTTLMELNLQLYSKTTPPVLCLNSLPAGRNGRG